jgi:hypothetical protein
MIKKFFLKLIVSKILNHSYLRRCCLALLNKTPAIKMKLRIILIENELPDKKVEETIDSQYSPRVLKIYETLVAVHDKKKK